MRLLEKIATCFINLDRMGNISTLKVSSEKRSIRSFSEVFMRKQSPRDVPLKRCSALGLKIREKYSCRSSFFIKVTGCRPGTLLTMNQDFKCKYGTVILQTYFLQNTYFSKTPLGGCFLYMVLSL